MKEKDMIFEEIACILRKHNIKDTDEMIEKLKALCEETERAGKIKVWV